MQEKGEVDEAELRALEEDVTGRVCTTPSTFRITLNTVLRQIMLASWRGTRFEVVNVLREVCCLPRICLPAADVH